MCQQPVKGEAVPQQHKGERAYVATRVPAPYYRKLEELKQATGLAKSEIVTEALMKYLDNINIEELEGQEQLPMTA